MLSDNSSYNPNFIYNGNPNWFMEFIHLQDEVPSNLVENKEDSIFLKHCIIQQKTSQSKSFSPSVFTSHLMKNPVIPPKEKEILNPGWITGVIVLCFMFYAIANFGYFKRMQQIFKAFFAQRLFMQLLREGGILGERISLFLFSSFLMGLSLFLYKIYEFYYHIHVSFFDSFILYLEILAGVIIFYLLKLGLYNLVGFIFKSSKDVSDYVLYFYIFGQITGILLLPIIVLVTYLPCETVIYASTLSLLLLYLYSMFLGITMAASKVKISVYYLFLYLCTLEILPLFLIAKVLIKMTG